MTKEEYKKLLDTEVHKWVASKHDCLLRDRLKSGLEKIEVNIICRLYGVYPHEWQGYRLRLRDLVKVPSEDQQTWYIFGDKTKYFLESLLLDDDLSLGMSSHDIEKLTGEADVNPFAPNKRTFLDDLSASRSLEADISEMRSLDDKLWRKRMEIHQALFDSCLEIICNKVSKDCILEYVEDIDDNGNDKYNNDYKIRLVLCNDHTKSVCIEYTRAYRVPNRFDISLVFEDANLNKQVLLTVKKNLFPFGKSIARFEYKSKNILYIRCMLKNYGKVTDKLIDMITEYYKAVV